MATVYTINGTTAELAPYHQKWRQIQIGRDHEQRAIYSANEEIDLMFDSASITMARQWLEAASSGSANVTVLARYGVGWTDLSAVQLEVVDPPAVEAGVALGWAMVIKGATAP